MESTSPLPTPNEPIGAVKFGPSIKLDAAKGTGPITTYAARVPHPDLYIVKPHSPESSFNIDLFWEVVARYAHTVRETEETAILEHNQVVNLLRYFIDRGRQAATEYPGSALGYLDMARYVVDMMEV
jgi:hypothetical protein